MNNTLLSLLIAVLPLVGRANFLPNYLLRDRQVSTTLFTEVSSEMLPTCAFNSITVQIGTSSFPDEVSYILTDDNGTEFLNITGGGAPASYELCLPNGCYSFQMFDAFGDGWNGATYSIQFTGGASIISGNFPNIPAFSAFEKTEYFLIGPGVLGCNDPGACNYDPLATCNNGSCDYTSCIGCMNSLACNYNASATIDDGNCCTENCLTIEMYDMVGDGWDDGVYNVRDEANTIIATGTLGYPLFDDIENLCLPDGCYSLTIEGSGYPEEITWTLNGAVGGPYSGDGLDNNFIYFSVGSGACYGCTDPTACTYNPFAFIDDGSCINGPCVAFDNPWTANAITLTNFPTCTTLYRTLVGATATAVATSADVTGEDIWFSFTSPTNGARFVVNSTSADIVLEILDDNYQTVQSVNLVAGIGGEVLNTDDLVAGESYYLGVRNFNSAIGTGAFSLCAMSLRSSRCPVNLGPYPLCSSLKAAHAGTTSYNFIFTDLSDMSVHAATQWSSTSILLNTINGLQYGGIYELSVQSVFTLQNSLGQNEVMYVNPSSSCVITIDDAPTVAVNSSWSCSNYGPINRNTWISFNPRICTVIGYEIELINQNGMQGPIYFQSMTTSRFFRFLDIPAALNGNLYNCRIRPLFNGYEGDWGPVVCLRVAGSASFWTISNDTESVFSSVSSSELNFSASVYPNPNDGHKISMIIDTESEEEVFVSVFDMMGRLIHSQRVIADGITNAELDADLNLASGMYNVTFVAGNSKHTERLIVRK